jgi:hypothetical protein
MTEFAIVAVVMFFTLFGTLEAGLLTFSVATARFAVGDGGRVASQEGNYWVSVTNQADTDVVAAIRRTSLGTTTLVSVEYIEVRKVNYNAGAGTLTPDPIKYNQYLLDGTCLNCPGGVPPWPANTRDVSPNGDFLMLTIKYDYQFKSGSLIRSTPLILTTQNIVRLEPQTW